MSTVTKIVFDGQLRPANDMPDRVNALLPSPCVQNHAANLHVIPDDELLCVWFGGTQEGIPDISIYLSRLAPGSEHWSEPEKVPDDPTRSEQNPILFERSGTLVRQPPIILANDDWILPVFYCRKQPGERWVGNDDISAVLASSDRGKSWQKYEVPDSAGCVHMNIVPLKQGGAARALPQSPGRLHLPEPFGGWSALERAGADRVAQQQLFDSVYGAGQWGWGVPASSTGRPCRPNGH